MIEGELHQAASRTSSRGEDGADPLGGAAVSVRVRRGGHAGVLGLVVEEAEGLADDAGRVGADEPERAGLDALGPLGLVAEDERGDVSEGTSSWIPPESVRTSVARVRSQTSCS